MLLLLFLCGNLAASEKICSCVRHQNLSLVHEDLLFSVVYFSNVGHLHGEEEELYHLSSLLNMCKQQGKPQFVW